MVKGKGGGSFETLEEAAKAAKTLFDSAEIKRREDIMKLRSPGWRMGAELRIYGQPRSDINS